MSLSPVSALGAMLSPAEAGSLAARLDAGETLNSALQGVAQARRAQVRSMLGSAGLGPGTRDLTVAVLRALEGAGRRSSSVTTAWTLPGVASGYGHLTTATADLVRSARESVVCSTYNFEKSSGLWDALHEVCEREFVTVTVYVDGEKGRPQEVSRRLPGATVFASRTVNGHHVRNHAKFVSVDHRFLIVTSANFSASAEWHNVELGLRVDDAALARQIEDAVFLARSSVFAVVGGTGS